MRKTTEDTFKTSRRVLRPPNDHMTICSDCSKPRMSLRSDGTCWPCRLRKSILTPEQKDAIAKEKQRERCRNYARDHKEEIAERARIRYAEGRAGRLKNPKTPNCPKTI